MKFERENTKPLEDPTARQVEASLGKLKGSQRSFARLIDDEGNFIQMAGGGFSCLIEIVSGKIIKRASQEEPIVPWQETTTLSTTCGEFEMDPREYFSIDQVKEAFFRYLNGDRKLEYLKWQEQELQP